MNGISLRRKSALIIFGIILFAVMLEAALRLGGFVYLSLQEYRNRLSLERSGSGGFRILCVGESTTALGGKNSYPALLEEILNQRLSPKKFSVINRGLPSLDTNIILSELEYNLNKYDPSMVIAMMGINDDSVSPERGGIISRIKYFVKSSRVYKAAALLSARLRSKDALKDAYFNQGLSFLELRRYPEAERMFKKAAQLAPREPLAYVFLGRCYYERGLNDEAARLIDKAQRLADKYPRVYVDLGWYYYDIGSFDRAQEMFNKAIEFNPRNPDYYYDMAQFCQSRGHYPEAEAYFKKAIELKPRDDYNIYVDFGLHYFERGMLSDAEMMLNKSARMNPDDPRVYWYLGFIKELQGEKGNAALYFGRIKSVLDSARQVTCRNYTQLRDIVLGRGIKLVCAQYPLRRVEDLKRFLDSDKGVVFVDNEDVFKKALKTSSYGDYFVDRFAGDFGHCTRKGNLLLADTIAQAIIKECFSDRQ